MENVGSKYIARIVCSGTKIDIPVSARSVDSGMLKLRKLRSVKRYHDACVLFFLRRDGSLVDCRNL